MKNGVNAWYGCRRDLRDARDRLMAPKLGLALPAAVDLRLHCPPVMNQGEIGSCTAHGVTAAARFHIIKRGGPYDFEMCRLQLYYDSREMEGSIASDAGAEIRDVIKTLAARGVGHEEFWPYEPSLFAERPPQEVYDDAPQYKALQYERVAVSAIALKQAIAAGHPVIIGISVYESFESDAVAKNGIVPMPGPHEIMVGGHCMLAVGYAHGRFIVRNSWGEDWGDKGDCYIPENYLGSPRYGSDYWNLSLFGSDAERAANAA